MHFALRYIPVIGTSTSFSKYWENEPDDALLVSKRGHLFGYIALDTDTSSNDLSQIISQIISQINQSYYTLDGSLFADCLKTSLSQTQTDWASNYNLSITLVAINDNTLATVSFGRSSLLIKRNSQFSQITPKDISKIDLVTGPVFDQDLLLMAHLDFISSIKDPNSFFATDIDQMEDFLKNQSNSFPFSSVLIKINQSQNQSFLPPPVYLAEASAKADLPHKPIVKTFFKKLFTPRPVTISSLPFKHVQTKNKRNLLLGLIAIIGLSISIVFGYVKNSQKQNQDKFEKLHQQVQTNLDNIDKIRQLNLEDAKVLAESTKDILNQMDSLKINPDKVSEFTAQIDTILAQTGSADFVKPDFVYDTSLITDKPDYSYVTYDGTDLYLLDTKSGRIDSLAGKSTRQISQEALAKDTISLLSFKSNLYALTIDGLYQVTKKNWTKDVTIKDNPISAVSWGSAIYYLSSTTIIRSSFINNVLADPVSWLETGQNFPDNPSSMAIDGKVWLLSKNGLVSVYLRGKKDNFTLLDPPSTSTASHLQIGQDKDLLVYLSDSKTVVVYTKTGQAISKYNLKDFDIKSIALDESKSLIYLLASDQKIYSLKL